MANHLESGEKRTLYGLFIAQGYPWDQMVEYAQLAESLGFDNMWVADHFVNPYSPEAFWYEGWTTLAGLAAETSKIRLGPMVTHVVYRNPAILARKAMTVDHISGGRLEIGVGSGGSRWCHLMTGVPNWKPRTRTERFYEAVEILDQLLRHEVSSFSGKHYRFKDARMHPQPVQEPRPPIIIAAHGPKALKLAAEYGDGWSHYWPGPDLTPEQALDVTRKRSERLTEFMLDLDRDPQLMKRSVAVGYTSDLPFSSMEALRDYIGRYQGIGFNEFIFGFTPGFDEMAERFITTRELLEEIAAEVVPGNK